MASAGQNQSTELGFIDDADSWLLTNRYFPSKVGGRAAWLELKNLPDNSDLLCEYCNEPCVFLCQIYAGSQSISHAFHRTIYVFICRNGKCCIENQNGYVRQNNSHMIPITFISILETSKYFAISYHAKMHFILPIHLTNQSKATR